MRIGIPTETLEGERRVAATPNSVKKTIKLGYEVSIQAGAGLEASFSDAAFEAVGASIVGDAASLWAQADIVFKVNPPSESEVAMLDSTKTLISYVLPPKNTALGTAEPSGIAGWNRGGGQWYRRVAGESWSQWNRGGGGQRDRRVEGGGRRWGRDRNSAKTAKELLRKGEWAFIGLTLE